MNNTQPYPAIGIPSFLVLFSLLTNMVQINRRSDKMDRNYGTLGDRFDRSCESLSAKMDRNYEKLSDRWVVLRNSSIKIYWRCKAI